MKVSYLCDARPGDVLDLHWDEVMDMGNYSEQNKTDTKQTQNKFMKAAVVISSFSPVTGQKTRSWLTYEK